MATRTVRRWAFKKRAQQDVRRICKVWKLMPISNAQRMAQEFWSIGSHNATKEAAEKCRRLADGLSIAALGPIGQAKYDAYQWAEQVILAKEWVSPQEMQSRMIN